MRPGSDHSVDAAATPRTIGQWVAGNGANWPSLAMDALRRLSPSCHSDYPGPRQAWGGRPTIRTGTFVPLLSVDATLPRRAEFKPRPPAPTATRP